MRRVRSGPTFLWALKDTISHVCSTWFGEAGRVGRAIKTYLTFSNGSSPQLEVSKQILLLGIQLFELSQKHIYAGGVLPPRRWRLEHEYMPRVRDLVIVRHSRALGTRVTVKAEWEKRCSHCNADGPRLRVCARCSCARYCSEECQRAHWRDRHKYECLPTNLPSLRQLLQV